MFQEPAPGPSGLQDDMSSWTETRRTEGGACYDNEESWLHEYVNCNICMELYNNENHVPVLLPCQHTFCRSCLNSISSRLTFAYPQPAYPQPRIECPVCRIKHEVPRGGFTVNRAVLQIAEESQRDSVRHFYKLWHNHRN